MKLSNKVFLLVAVMIQLPVGASAFAAEPEAVEQGSAALTASVQASDEDLIAEAEGLADEVPSNQGMVFRARPTAMQPSNNPWISRSFTKNDSQSE